jgi:hypothetical protein
VRERAFATRVLDPRIRIASVLVQSPVDCWACTQPFRVGRSALSAERTLESDAGERSGHQGDGIVSVRDLTALIEQRDEHKPRKSARHGGKRDFRRDNYGSSRTFMVVGQMPLAPGTGGHGGIIGPFETLPHR